MNFYTLLKIFFSLALVFYCIPAFSQINLPITRYEGVGTGENFLELTENTKSAILANNTVDVLTYNSGQGPINVTNIFDPSLALGTYRLRFLDSNFTTQGEMPVHWMLEDINTNEQWTSDGMIDVFNDQIIVGRGFSLAIRQVADVGVEPTAGNGFIGSSISYANNSPNWLRGLRDDSYGNFTNFIRTGFLEEDEVRDPQLVFSNVVSGTWYPYPLVAWKLEPVVNSNFITPAWTSSFSGQVDFRNKMESLNNVNIVMTSDKSKWSRCVVVNTFSDNYILEGMPNPDAPPFEIRTGASIDKDGNPDGTGTGMSWFPGYAIDVETGERLNIFFGENAYFANDPNVTDAGDIGMPEANGKDMIFNPSDINLFFPDPNNPVFTSIEQLPLGGQHFVYVTKSLYDECSLLASGLTGSAFDKINAWSTVSWTSAAMLADGTSMLPLSQGLIPNDVTIKLRVNNPYAKREATNTNDHFPMYEFTIDESTITSIKGFDNQIPVLLSNNPTSLSETEITYLKGVPKNSIISLLSSDGKLLKQWESTLGDKVNLALNPSELEIETVGIYYLHILSEEGASAIKKWVILP